jgi:hypothetical protein
MKRNAGRRSWERLFFCAGIGIALAIGASGPAFAIYAASSALCYGSTCSKQGYDVYVPSVTDTFHDGVNSSVPDATGNFDETSRADASARAVSFEVSFIGGELYPDVFLGGSPRGRYTMIALMGADGEDELTITAPGLVNGYVTLDALLDAGGVNSCTAVDGCSSGLPVVFPDLNGQFFTQVGDTGSGDTFDVNELTAVGGISQLYTSPYASFVAGVPFSVRLGVQGQMTLHALLDYETPPPLFNSASSLGMSLTVALHVFDANHQPLANATIVSDTGTNWTTVPEPAEVASSLAAALGLAVASKCRRLRRGRSGRPARTRAASLPGDLALIGSDGASRASASHAAPRGRK